MATYYVAGSGNDSTGNGSSGNPWRSLGKGHQQAGPGDTVIVRNGTYEEQLVITKANMTWRADAGHTPVVNGRYHIGLMSGGNTITQSSTLPRIDSANYLPPGANGKAGLITINGAGVTVDGFVAQNSSGSGILINAANVTVKNCTTYFTYSSGILSNPGSKVGGLLIENNVVRFASVKIFDPARHTGYAGGCGGQCVDGSIKIGNNSGDTILRGNDVGWGFGEGINIGKYNVATAAQPIIVEGNWVHDINHSYLYINHSKWVHLRGNVAYCTGHPMHLWDDDAPVGIRIADEAATGARDLFIYNNLVVNLGYSTEWGGRHTQSSNVYYGHNTFVGGPLARKPAVYIVRQEQGGAVDQRGLFENNVIDYSMTSLAVANVTNATGNAGATLRNNNWSKSPPGAAGGPGDVVGLPRLVRNNRALVVSGYPTKANVNWLSVNESDTFDVDDYQLTSSSPGRGAASNGSAASGVTPPAGTATDIYGNGRDATPANRDVGAFEFGGSAPPTDDLHADFSFMPGGGDAPVEIVFMDESTGEGAAAADMWAWDFWDGGTATTQNPAHTYVEAGLYMVTLIVTDSDLGISDSISMGPIVVSSTPDPTISADFTAEGATSGALPLTVHFIDLSGGPVATWLWDFGDGTTSTSQNATHTYEQEGVFDVSLMVTDGASATDTKTVVEFVTVAIPSVRRFVVGPIMVVDVESPERASATHHDLSDDGDTGRGGYGDVATNRPRPAVWLTEQADAPEAVAGELVIWFDEDGTMKARLPGGSVRTFTWS